MLPLRANDAQQMFECEAGQRNIVLKARQLGITTWIAARFFIATILRPGTVSVLVAQDDRAAQAIFRIVQRFLANLPEPLRAALRTARANVRQLVFAELDSEYRIESAADVEAGRGLTIHHLHCSEVASWPRDPRDTLASLRAAVAPAGEIVLESTAKGAGGCFYDEWRRAPETGYVQHFFPWWIEPAYVLATTSALELENEERELKEHAGLSDAQLAFRRDVRAQFGALAPQEFAEDATECFLASAECVFDLAAVSAAQACAPAPLESRDNGRLLIWFPPRENATYIMGVDSSGGGASGDYAVAQVIDRDGTQCAELRAHLPAQELATAVARLAREYNGAHVAVERNNHGHAVIAHLHSGELYQNLFEDKDKKPGWVTSAASRPSMLEQFAIMLRAETPRFSSPHLLAECRSFVRRNDGSAAAAPGAHDDCILAMAVALAVRARKGLVPKTEQKDFFALPQKTSDYDGP